MHGDIDRAVIQCLLQLFDEDAFVKSSIGLGDFGERDVGAAIAGGLDHLAFDFQLRKGLGEMRFCGACLD